MLCASGVDVSNHQGTIDFDALAPHVDFVIAKASQGVGYRDPYYVRNREECLRLDIPFGAYHWLEPAEMYGAPDEIVEQVRLFKSALQRTEAPDIVCTLDVESTPPGGGRRVGDPSPNDIAFAVEVHENELVHTPLAYGGEPVLLPAARVRPEIARCRLWKAIYPMANNGDPKAKDRGPGTLDPWTDLTMWQWTSRGSLPGIFSAGLDMNDLFVPLADLMLNPPEVRVSQIWTPGWAQEPRPGRVEYYGLLADGHHLIAWNGAELRDPSNPSQPHPGLLSGPDGLVLNLEDFYGPGPYSGVSGFDRGQFCMVANGAACFKIPTGRVDPPVVGVAGPKGDKGDPGIQGPSGPVDLASLRIVRS